MNYKELKRASELYDEIKHLDNFTIDVQNPARTLKVCSPFDGVTIKKEHRTKILKVLFGIRGELAEELEKLGVTEYDDND